MRDGATSNEEVVVVDFQVSARDGDGDGICGSSEKWTDSGGLSVVLPGVGFLPVGVIDIDRAGPAVPSGSQ